MHPFSTPLLEPPFRYEQLKELPCSHGTAEAERLFAHSLTTWRNMNIRDHIISYCGQAVEDLLLYPQIAGAKQFFVAISAVLNTALLHQFSFLSLVLKSQELHKTSNTNIVMILK